MNILLNNKVAIDGESATDAAPDLCGRIDAVSVESDVFEFLQLMHDVARAPESARHAVATSMMRELASLDAQIEADAQFDAQADDGS